MKTLGKLSAAIIAGLYDNNKPIFTINDVLKIRTTTRSLATKLLYDMAKRKLIFRLKNGKYAIIPQELGSMETFAVNNYVIAREVANSPDYYIGFYSAMAYWGMTTHPIVNIFVATDRRQLPPKTFKNKISFVYLKKSNIWGIKEEWVTKTYKVRISDIEKTVVDALAHPKYCGGISEIAKSIWIVKDKIDFTRLLQYVTKSGKNVIAKRLGYILEALEIGNNIIPELNKYRKVRYDWLDSTVKQKKLYKNDWKLLDNIGREQITKIISA